MSEFVQGSYFGIISGTITTIGLIMGLSAGTSSKLAIIVGILTIAISDTLSEAFGMYMSKKVVNTANNSKGPIITASGVVFAKFLISVSFLIPILMNNNIIKGRNISIAYAFIIIIAASSYLTKLRKEPLVQNVVKYIFITIIVISLTHYSGRAIANNIK